MRAPRAAGRAGAARSRSSSAPSCRWPTRSPRASGRARSPRTRSRTASAQPFDYWNARRLRRGDGRAGRALARLAPDRQLAPRGCSPTPRWAPACSPSCSRSRAGPRRPRCSARSIWFALVPLRLRSLPVLLIPSVLAAGVAAWALSKDPFSKSLQPLSAKEAVAGEFGVLVVLMLVLLLLAGAAVEATAARRVPSARLRRRIGIVAVGVACLVPLVAFTSVAFSDRGHRRPPSRAHERDAGRAQGGRRPRVRRVLVAREVLARGVPRVRRPALRGRRRRARSPSARLRHRTDASVTRHAHGWIPQTVADLGILGLHRHHGPRAGLAARRAERRPTCSRAGLMRGGRTRATTTSCRRAATGTTRASPSSTVAIVPVVFGAAVAGRLDLVHPGARRRWRSWPAASWRAATRVGAEEAPAEPIRWRPERDRIVLAVVTLLTARPARLGDLAARGLRPRDERRARARRRSASSTGARAGRRTRRSSTRSPPTRCSCAPRSTRRRSARTPRATASRRP